MFPHSQLIVIPKQQLKRQAVGTLKPNAQGANELTGGGGPC